jgi:riboflavin kinase/FMN adenylyltransferase
MHVLTTEIDNLALPKELLGEALLTVGAFDGIHIGHQTLIRRLVSQAQEQGRLSGMVTFYPHPAVVLHPERPARYLTTPGEKAVLLESSGLDWVVMLSFTPSLAGMAPRGFCQVLVERLGMRELWVGPDVALGRGRAGDLSILRDLGTEMEFQVHEVPYVTQDGEKVSSTQIRRLVQRGHVEQVASLLARPYSISGEVVHGAQRGRCLGFPTANVDVPAERVVPANGIYATVARLGEQWHQSVTSIGVRPTFDNGARSVETYLLDFDGDLYGRDLVVEFVARLRPEKRFADIQDLVTQIGEDVAQSRKVLASYEPLVPADCGGSYDV